MTLDNQELFPTTYRPPPQSTEYEEVAEASSLEERIALTAGGEQYVARLQRIRVPVTRPPAPTPPGLRKVREPIPWGVILWIASVIAVGTCMGAAS